MYSFHVQSLSRTSGERGLTIDLCSNAPILFYLQVAKASSLHLHKKVTTSKIRGMQEVVIWLKIWQQSSIWALLHSILEQWHLGRGARIKDVQNSGWTEAQVMGCVRSLHAHAPLPAQVMLHTLKAPETFGRSSTGWLFPISRNRLAEHSGTRGHKTELSLNSDIKTTCECLLHLP